MHQHQQEKGAEAFCPSQGDNGQASDQLTYGQEFFRRKIPVRKLGAEKHGGE